MLSKDSITESQKHIKKTHQHVFENIQTFAALFRLLSYGDFMILVSPVVCSVYAGCKFCTFKTGSEI